MSKIRDMIKFKSENYVKDGIKDKKRVSSHGEVYTPENIVNDMLDLTCDSKDKTNTYQYTRINLDESEEVRERSLGDQLLTVDKVFLEPACGNGNFLVAIIERKLMRAVLDAKDGKSDIKFGVFKAFATTYGVDILADNVLEARQRMLEEIISNKELVRLLDKEPDNDVDRLIKSIEYVLDKNIILGNFLTKKYVEDTSTRGRNKINKGLKDQEIRVYNWKTKDVFDESGLIQLTYASFDDLENETSENNDRYYLDYELKHRKKRVKEGEDGNAEVETEETLESLSDTVSEENQETDKKEKKRKRTRKVTEDDGCIPEGM